MFLVLLLVLVVDKILYLVLSDANIDSIERLNDAANSIPELSDIFWVQFESFPNILDAGTLAYFFVLVNHSPDVLNQTFAII